MRTTSIISFLTAALLLGAGCSRERLSPAPQPVQTFTIPVDVPGSPLSKSFGEDQERYLQTVDVLLFELSGTEERLASRHKIPAADIDNAGLIRTFKVNLNADASKQYRIVLLANLRDEADAAETAGDLVTGKTKKEALEAVTFDASAVWNTTGATPRYLPMWGESEKLYTINESTVFTTIQLLRAVARIDITVDASIQAKFEIEKIRLYRYIPEGTAAPRAGLYSHATRRVSAPTLPPAAASGTPLEYTATAADRSAGEIYLPEHDNQGDKPLALLIGASWEGAATTWYRIEMVDTDTDRPLDILRNHVYAVTIADVAGPGYDDPEQSLTGVRIGAEVIPWDASDYVTPSLDGDYSLTVDKTRFHFNYDGRTGESRSNSYDDHKIDITTNYPAGWEVSKVTDMEGNELTGDDCWVTIRQGYHQVPIATSFYDQNQWYWYGEKYDAEQCYLAVDSNDSGTLRSARVHLRAGKWEYVIHVTQDPFDLVCGENGVPLLQRIGENDYLTHKLVDPYMGYIRCWMFENLREHPPGFENNDDYYRTTYGGYAPGERGYYYQASKVHKKEFEPCPDGWRRPSGFEVGHLGNALVPSLPPSHGVWFPMADIHEWITPFLYQYWFDESNMAGYLMPTGSTGYYNWGDQLYMIQDIKNHDKEYLHGINLKYEYPTGHCSVGITGINNQIIYTSVRCVKDMD